MYLYTKLVHKVKYQIYTRLSLCQVLGLIFTTLPNLMYFLKYHFVDDFYNQSHISCDGLPDGGQAPVLTKMSSTAMSPLYPLPTTPSSTT